MKIWKAVVLGLAATAAVVIALTITVLARGYVLLAYVVFLFALLSVVLVNRLRRLLPPTAEFPRMLPPPALPQTNVEQFETVKRWVAMARYSRSDLYFRLRAPVRDIVAAHLARNHGVDLEREPDRAAAILGEGYAWEIVRRDQSSRPDHSAPGWSEHQLEQLVEELEDL